MKSSPSKQSLEIARQYWRTWTLDQLLQDRHNYDFSAIIPWKKAGAEKDIEAAWQIELDRELGLICEPYLTTWERDSLDDVPYPKKLKGLRELFSTQDYCLHSRHHEEKKTVMLEIDTKFSILELVDSFHHWLEHHCYPQGANNNFGKGLPGRADIFPGWFKELAIYRCANAGLSRKFGEEHLLVDFLKNLAAAVPTQKSESRPTPSISDSYWSHAVTRTENRIYERLINLLRHTALVKRGMRATIDINDPWQKYLGKLR